MARNSLNRKSLGTLRGAITRGRRECPSCRVHARHPGLRLCHNCGHPYGEPAAPRPAARQMRPTLISSR
jgi:hypothetical protein